jgi:4-hydroxysphinganine ceramide fatty acyl 2-hydroxylase
MKDFKINNKGTGQLFKNKTLERLSRTHFTVPVIFYYLVAAVSLYYTIVNYSIPFLTYFLLFPAGMIVFTLVEYLIHRFIFHFNATNEKEVELQYNIHGIHHEYPRDKYRLVMPPLISILISSLFCLLFIGLFHERGLIIFGGFVAGYSTYLIIHYAVHALKPPNNFLKYLWRHHSMHHYSSVHSAFSVSFPLWDKIFGTMPPETSNESKTVS